MYAGERVVDGCLVVVDVLIVDVGAGGRGWMCGGGWCVAVDEFEALDIFILVIVVSAWRMNYQLKL